MISLVLKYSISFKLYEFKVVPNNLALVVLAVDISYLRKWTLLSRPKSLYQRLLVLYISCVYYVEVVRNYSVERRFLLIDTHGNEFCSQQNIVITSKAKFTDSQLFVHLV